MDELKLLAGFPIDFGIGYIHPLKLKEIIEIGESEYNKYLNVLLYDPTDVDIKKEMLDQLGITELTTYDFLIISSLQNVDFRILVIQSLEYFLKEKVGFFDKQGVFYLGSPYEKRFITRERYKDIKTILIKQNYLKELEEEEELTFGNELARQWYMKLKRKEKQQPKPKPQITLHSLISAIMWKSNKSTEEILNMTIYQLYDGYYRLFLIDNCSNLNQGIYHGAINPKDIKNKDLNWAKIIKIDN